MGGKAEFKKMDGDDASSAPFKEKWGVTGYPTLIFTDNSQAALAQHGSFGSAEEFKSMIGQFVK